MAYYPHWRLSIKKVCCILLSFLTSLAYAELSPLEKNIQSFLAKQKQAQLHLLEKLVNIQSGTTNPKGVYQVGKIMQSELNKLGFKTHWVYLPANMKHAGTLIAEHHGDGKPLLLIGHLDTVFSPSYTKQFSQKKMSASGPGVIDDKGGLIVLLFALKALHQQHLLQHANITVVLTGDEEESGKPTRISRKPLLDAAKGKAIALDFEPAVTLDTLTIARRGVSQWLIAIKGNESHSATIFKKDTGAGAIFEAGRLLDALRKTFGEEKDLVFNPGLIAGGTKVSYTKETGQASVFGKANVIAKTAIIKGDYRFLNEKQKEKFEAKLKEISKDALPGTSSTVSFEAGIPAMAEKEGNLTLLNKYSEVSKDLGQGSIKPLPAGLRGAGDISFIADVVPANLSGLGPVGWGAHSVIESIEIPSITIQTERAAILMSRLIK